MKKSTSHRLIYDIDYMVIFITSPHRPINDKKGGRHTLNVKRYVLEEAKKVAQSTRLEIKGQINLGVNRLSCGAGGKLFPSPATAFSVICGGQFWASLRFIFIS